MSNRLLQPGNHKTGIAIATFSLPAVLTCPGKSNACLAACYARRGRFQFPDVRLKYAQNLKAAKRPEFVDRIVQEIHTAWYQVVRVHVSGDLFGYAYAMKWVAIAQRAANCTFYAYTRSWRVPALVPALGTLARLANFRLWLSADRDTGMPPPLAGTRIAYLDDHVQPVPALPADSIVFRLKRHTVQKRIGLALVCPPENGVTETTCQQCKLCWR